MRTPPLVPSYFLLPLFIDVKPAVFLTPTSMFIPSRRHSGDWLSPVLFKPTESHRKFTLILPSYSSMHSRRRLFFCVVDTTGRKLCIRYRNRIRCYFVIIALQTLVTVNYADNKLSARLSKFLIKF